MKIGDKVKLRRRLYERGVLARFPAGTILKIIGPGMGLYHWNCVTESGQSILMFEDDAEPCGEGESQIVPILKEGWLGRIFYTFDGKILTLLPYEKRPGEVGFPTMADLTQPITITIDWLKELIATTESRHGEETDTKEKG